ncbi:N-6 DNA methylase [Actinoplanes sp. NPDC020271]|uniref:N-6 DNA methylase n=1 Tax=Actinoplanes sp. NPDC020271 TaxID=3363896 RepID=UPI0037AD0357
MSNWRKRYDTFPVPVGGTAASPQFDLEQVERWLVENEKLGAVPEEDLFWRNLLAAESDPAEALALVGEHLSGERPLLFEALRANLDSLAERLGKGGREGIFEQLWWRFSEQIGPRLVTTPEPLAATMINLARVRGGTVLDPACGTGHVLYAAARVGASCVYGQDVDASLARLARLSLVVNEFQGEIRTGDSLRHDAFPGVMVDAVVAHPPFGLSNWGQEELGGDHRWEFGVPPRTEPELAWVQHAYAHLKPGGRAVLLMPPSVAGRRAGRRIRADLLRRGALRAVVALPQRVTPSYAVNLQLWILQRPTQAPPPDVLLADASILATRDMRDDNEILQRVEIAVSAFLDEGDAGDPSFAYPVPVIELLDEEVDLAPARRAPIGADHDDVAGELRALHAAVAKQVKALSKGIPALPSASDGAPPPTVSIADLGRAGVLEILGPIRDAGTDDVVDDTPVLTAKDVVLGSSASRGGEERPSQRIPLQDGDIVIPLVARQMVARYVADAGGSLLGRNMYLLRPKPDAVDPWFLLGYLRTESNERLTTSSSGGMRIDVRKAQVPRIPVAEQHRHGEVFRALDDFNTLAQQVASLTADMARLTAEGLTSGKLRPTEEN